MTDPLRRDAPGESRVIPGTSTGSALPDGRGSGAESSRNESVGGLATDPGAATVRERRQWMLHR
jgi:hypothetical protein